MYFLQTENSFDSAHFLYGYDGKCKNIHGHRWRVLVSIFAESLSDDKQTKGMIVDFSELKRDVKEITDFYDHALIYEKNTLKPATVTALNEEMFRLIEVDFRPTAENFSHHFYTKLKSKGYNVKSVSVYETPANCAVYTEE